MIRSVFLSLAGLAALLGMARSLTAGNPAPVTPNTASPVVVELFTSQGCSSCPPADAYLEELAKRSNVIALTRPVTYWDRLGWKDTLAREENTQLQRAYAARKFDRQGVYTPQMVVQGGYGAVGSDRKRVQSLIANARPMASLRYAAGRVSLTGAGVEGAEVRLLAVKSQRIVRIGRGENGGRVIRYSNIVISEKPLGRWKASSGLALPAAQLSVAGADRYALVAVRGPAGAIVAATWL